MGNAGDGIHLDYTATGYTVGGVNQVNQDGSITLTAGNVIAGNSGCGVNLLGASGDLVEGNLIGTDSTGEGAVPNSSGGVSIESQSVGEGSNNTIGGTTPGARNLISGNSYVGLQIITDQSGGSATGNIVEGDYIGTDVTGTRAVANTFHGGVLIEAVNSSFPVSGNIIARNVISGNETTGVGIFGLEATGDSVLGNKIGTDRTGTARLANGGDGIEIEAPGSTIGGSNPGDANTISGNDGDGIDIVGSGTSDNVVAGNDIGTDATGAARWLGNASLLGIVIDGGSWRQHRSAATGPRAMPMSSLPTKAASMGSSRS